MDRQYLEFLSGEGSGTPLQYSRLENPMDGGAWKAAVHGVAKSRTWLTFHFSLSCTGEGNGNPLQCSCLENPRDGGAWWAAIYGVSQSRTWLKRLSSSSSSNRVSFTRKWKRRVQRPRFSPLFPSFSISLVLLSFSSFLSSWTWIKESLFKV